MSAIDKLREMGLLQECWSCHGVGKHPQFASDSDGGTCRVCKGTGYDDSSEVLAAVALEQAEEVKRAESDMLEAFDRWFKEKARADEAEAMLRLHWEDGYTTYEDFLADLKRRTGGETP